MVFLTLTKVKLQQRQRELAPKITFSLMIESTKNNDTLCNQAFRSNYPLYAVICNSYLNCAKADGSPAALVAADKILDIMPLNEVRHRFDTIIL